MQGSNRIFDDVARLFTDAASAAQGVRREAETVIKGGAERLIRDMDVAAEVIGIRPMWAKLSAFAVSSFFVGVAGALWGFVHLGSWEPAAFSVDRSFQLLFMVNIGGMGSIVGAFWGGMTIGLVQQLSTLILPTQLQNAAIFVVFLLIVFLRPQGFFGRALTR